MVSLREAREARGLSIRALAARAGVGESTLVRIEHGRTRPGPAVARRVSDALGLSPVQIAEFSGRRPAPAGAPPRVLVVDDEPDVRAMLADLLVDEGYAVSVAADGLAALEAAGEDPPDAVLTDLRMPGLDGHGLIRRLRERGVEAPVVVMSALRDRPLVPGVPFVAKPFHVERLLAELDGVLRPGAERGRPSQEGEGAGGWGASPANRHPEGTRLPCEGEGGAWPRPSIAGATRIGAGRADLGRVPTATRDTEGGTRCAGRGGHAAGRARSGRRRARRASPGGPP